MHIITNIIQFKLKIKGEFYLVRSAWKQVLEKMIRKSDWGW